MLGTIVLVLLILMLLGSFPRWPHSREWGYRPLGIIGTLLIIYIILVLLGHIEIMLFSRPALAP
ncbi:MAG: DUF3309 family protein [Gammaproteobacteria bacterium]